MWGLLRWTFTPPPTPCPVIQATAKPALKIQESVSALKIWTWLWSARFLCCFTIAFKDARIEIGKYLRDWFRIYIVRDCPCNLAIFQNSWDVILHSIEFVRRLLLMGSASAYPKPDYWGCARRQLWPSLVTRSRWAHYFRHYRGSFTLKST